MLMHLFGSAMNAAENRILPDKVCRAGIRRLLCHRLHSYLFETDGNSDWMAKHFFSGGMMLGESLLAHWQQHLELSDRWRWDGRHYERTCNEWLKRQDANKAQLTHLFHDTYGPRQAVVWLNRWRMFFMACAELFGFRNGSEWWVSHYLFERCPL